MMLGSRKILEALLSLNVDTKLIPFLEFDNETQVFNFGYQSSAFSDNGLRFRPVSVEITFDCASCEPHSVYVIAVKMLTESLERGGFKFTKVCNCWDRY